MFANLETILGVDGRGEGALKGKSAATVACIEDFREFLIGADPMQVEHYLQAL